LPSPETRSCSTSQAETTWWPSIPVNAGGRASAPVAISTTSGRSLTIDSTVAAVSSRTTAHHHNPLRRLGPRQIGPFAFASDDGVLNARHAATGVDAVNAPLVVAHALSDIVQCSGLRLVRHVRIGDQRPVHDAQVGLSLGDDLVGLDRIHDARSRDHRHLDDRSNACRQVRIDAEFEAHVRHGGRFADVRLGRSANHVEVVDQLQFAELAADLLHLAVIEPVL